MELTNQAIAEFFWPVRIYIEDTDAGGIVFYVNYLKYMERARTECLRALGFAKAGLFSDDSMFVVHSLSVDYKAPARLDDEIVVEAHIMRVKKTFLEFRQCVWRNQQLLCSANVKVACVSRLTMRPCVIPQVLASALEKLSD